MEPSGRPPAGWIYKEAEMPVGPLAKDNSTGWRLGDRTTAPPPLPPALSFLFLLPLVLGAPTFTALPPSATREDWAWHTEPYATGAGALPSRETAQSSTAAGASGKKSGRLRLVGGPGPCRGRVEVLYAGGWGTVCDDDWDFADARVACREAGCGPALGATGLGHFGYGSGPVLLDNVGCAGTEARLSDCFHLGWGQHNCGHHEDAGALCSGPEELGLQAQQEGAETTRVPTPRPRDATRFQTLF